MQRTFDLSVVPAAARKRVILSAAHLVHRKVLAVGEHQQQRTSRHRHAFHLTGRELARIGARLEALTCILHEGGQPDSRIDLKNRRLCSDELPCAKAQFILGNCAMRCSRLWLPASLYLVHPWTRTCCIPAVVFGFRPRRASHPDRSASNRSDGYAFCSAHPGASPLRGLRENALPASFSADRSSCFTHHALIPETLMNYAGKVIGVKFLS